MGLKRSKPRVDRKVARRIASLDRIMLLDTADAYGTIIAQKLYALRMFRGAALEQLAEAEEAYVVLGAILAEARTREVAKAELARKMS